MLKSLFLLPLARLHFTPFGYVPERSQQPDRPALVITEELVLTIDDPNFTIRPDDPIFERRGCRSFPDFVPRLRDNRAIVRMHDGDEVLGRGHESLRRYSEDAIGFLRPLRSIGAEIPVVAPKMGELLGPC